MIMIIRTTLMKAMKMTRVDGAPGLKFNVFGIPQQR